LALLVHTARVGLVVALLMAIPSPQPKWNTEAASPPSLDRVREVHADAAVIDGGPDAAGMWSVRDQRGELIARVARTLPLAKDVVGYRGPTEAMILFDQDLMIANVQLIDSSDTAEHVDAVVQDELFFEQFKGWPWGGPGKAVDIDAVSGATLTSLALAEGVLKRIGGDRPSLVFPAPLSVSEVTTWFEGAAVIDDSTNIAVVKDAAGAVLGRVLRTGTLTDDRAGYQGPTELLMKLSAEGRIEKIRLRKSYDNEPYVDYVRVEAGFWAIFAGKSLSELAAFDPAAAGVEGVSGATMTSLAVADTIVAAAKAAQQANASESAAPGNDRAAGLRWTAADVGTIAVLLLLALASRLRWFHHRLLRRAWLLAVVMVIGLWAGNLMSLALVAGWSAEGIAWRLAPGLSAIAIVAMCTPALTKSNVYCNHLCPHGAIQQLIKPSARSRLRIHPSSRATKWLTRIPAVILVVAYLALISFPRIDLSAWEPFHAYLFRIAGGGAFILAGASLIVAAVIPMGYCRFGCPTGSLLDYLRRTATSDRVQLADYVAIALLLFALLMHW
jgi:Na+-translocating ferredoxin:NAD+ oxidoreductase RnfG subunit